MVVYVLSATFIIGFFIAYFMTDRNIISPACVFCAVFVVASLDLIRNIDLWAVELHWNTYAVMVGGTFVFIAVCICIHAIYGGNTNRRVLLEDGSCLTYIDISTGKLYFALFINFLAFFSVAMFVAKIAISYGASLNILSMISTYRFVTTRLENEIISFPSYVNYLQLISTSSGFVWMYILVNNYFFDKKLNRLVLLNIIIILAEYFMKGSRGYMLFLALSSIPIYYFLWCSKSNRIRKLSFKFIRRCVVILVAIALSFKLFGSLMGKTVSSDWLTHLSINLSAPIYNLDLFIQERWIKPNVWGYNTFGYLVSTLGRHLGVNSWVHSLDNPFRYANGVALGNVSTTFYAFFYDFGYAGVPILIGIMAAISQICYERCKRNVLKKSKIRFSVILYANIFLALAFSFFSNKFYEGFAKIAFIEQLLIWWGIIWWLDKRRLKIKI